jgi:RNA polymerase sigma factor (sigma-70 family)
MNTAFTRYQKLSKEGERFAAIDPEYEQLIGAQQEHVAFNTRQDAIERVLKRLPKHFAYVLRLHYLERWPQEDIARETGEKVGTVKARIHRAKAAFRAEASDEEIASIM